MLCRPTASLIAVTGFLLSGCVIHDVGVTNPIPGLSRVAVVPFFNLSMERTVDGRRFANAYFAELQKVPGFQVLPVGVAEQAIIDNELQMNKPEDILELARILDVDAVVVGAVTEYNPYYPPRVGLQVSWYSPRPWRFSPGLPADPAARRRLLEPLQPQGLQEHVVAALPAPLASLMGHEPAEPCAAHPPAESAPAQPGIWQPPLPRGAAFDPHEPLMSYTRMFDGAEADLVAALRDYVELSGDVRSGGWEGYLHRSEDFIRFASHLMITEMLTLHGGQARHSVILKWRNLE